MYKFTRTVVGEFALHSSSPDVGQEHHKRFGSGVTPHNQWTLNIYTRGRFEVEIPSIAYRREMVAGDTSLDIELAAMPPDLCIERCLDAGSQRICISPITQGASWARQIVELQAGSAFVAPAGHVLVVASGYIEVDSRMLEAGAAELMGDDTILRTSAPARALMMAIL